MIFLYLDVNSFFCKYAVYIDRDFLFVRWFSFGNVTILSSFHLLSFLSAGLCRQDGLQIKCNYQLMCVCMHNVRHSRFTGLGIK